MKEQFTIWFKTVMSYFGAAMFGAFVVMLVKNGNFDLMWFAGAVLGAALAVVGCYAANQDKQYVGHDYDCEGND